MSRASEIEHELNLELPCSDASCVWCQPDNIERTRVVGRFRPMIYPRDLASPPASTP